MYTTYNVCLNTDKVFKITGHCLFIDYMKGKPLTNVLYLIQVLKIKLREVNHPLESYICLFGPLLSVLFCSEGNDGHLNIKRMFFKKANEGEGYTLHNSAFVVVVVVALLFYVHGKHLRSCRDSQLT